MKKAICTKAVKGIVLGTIIVLGVAGVLVVETALPQYYSSRLWIVPAIFLMMSCVMLRTIDGFEGKTQRQILNRMMIYKNVKLLVCIAAIVIFYFLLEGSSRNGFLIVFMVYFLIMTVLETFAFGNFERAKKLREGTYKNDGE